MIQLSRIAAASACAIAVAFFAIAPTARAQNGGHHAPITLVLSTQLLSGSHVTIIRRAHQTPQMVIVVDDSTTPQQLVAAYGVLGASRAVRGDTLAADLTIQPHAALNMTALADQVIAADGTLRILKQAPITEVPGFGHVRNWDVDGHDRPIIGRK